MTESESVALPLGDAAFTTCIITDFDEFVNSFFLFFSLFLIFFVFLKLSRKRSVKRSRRLTLFYVNRRIAIHVYLKVTFTPAEYAPQEIKQNSVPSELYFGTTTTMEYKMDAAGNYSAEGTPTDILTFSNASDGVFSPNITWTKESDGTFTYTMDEEALRAAISLSQTFVLDTKAEHDAFRDALTGNVVARVTDGKVNNQ